MAGRFRRYRNYWIDDARCVDYSGPSRRANRSGDRAPMGVARIAIFIRVWTQAKAGCPARPLCCDLDPEGQASISAALTWPISAWRACSFQPPPMRLVKSLCSASPVSRQFEQTGVAERALREIAHIGYLISEQQKNDLSDASSRAAFSPQRVPGEKAKHLAIPPFNWL